MENENVQSPSLELPPLNISDIQSIPIGKSQTDNEEEEESPSILTLGRQFSEIIKEKVVQGFQFGSSFTVRELNQEDHNRVSHNPTSYSLDQIQIERTLATEGPGDNQRATDSSKKWVFVQICKFGLHGDDLSKALKFINTLPENHRDHLLQQTLDHIYSNTDVLEDAVAQPQKPLASPIKKTQFLPNQEIIKKKEETCEICAQDVPESMIKKPLDCNHSCCHECCIAYLTEKIDSNQVLSIGCPFDGCASVFTDDQVRLLTTQTLYNRYATFKKNAILNQNPNLRWCLRTGCGKYIVGEPNSKTVVCECGMQICFLCRNENHPGQTCESLLDDGYKKYLKKQDVQRCPHCKNGVEKIDGCNHMTCPVCQYQWCWLCGGHYNRTHFSALNPFGCGGLQRGGHTRSRWPKWKIYIIRLLKLILGLILVVVGLPLAWIAVGIWFPYQLNHYIHNRRSRRRYRRKTCCQSTTAVVLGVVLLPIWMICALIFFIVLLYDKAKHTRRMRERSRRRRMATELPL